MSNTPESNDSKQANHFKVKLKTKLDDLKPGDVLPTSDFATITPQGNFVQLEYIEQKFKRETYDVEPGVFSIMKSMDGLKLEKTSFASDKILPTFNHTKNIVHKIDTFFSKLSVYKKYNIEIPKRAILLYGPPGGGKTASISEIIKNYDKMHDTCVVVWHTDKINPSDVKAFIKTFKYNNVSKMILIIEDLGGVEIDQARIESTSSLLSLLDNQEKTFTVPVAIIATTNHPEAFLGNITQRPGRFDDKIEVGYPNSDERKKLYEFFAQDEINKTELEEIGKSDYKEFTPAHIKEIFLKSDIYDLSKIDAMKQLVLDIKAHKDYFQANKASLGIKMTDYSYDD